MLERSQLSGEVQLAVLEGLLEAGHELSAKDATKHFDGEKKSRARFYPLRVIETQPARRNDTMHMGVQTKPLVPSVQSVSSTLGLRCEEYQKRKLLISYTVDVTITTYR